MTDDKPKRRGEIALANNPFYKDPELRGSVNSVVIHNAWTGLINPLTTNPRHSPFFQLVNENGNIRPSLEP